MVKSLTSKKTSKRCVTGHMGSPEFCIRKTPGIKSGGPVSRILSRAFIYLGPARCRGPLAAYPQDDDCRATAGRAVYSCCLALLRVEFTVPLPLPEGRCALTAPFHPCRRPGSRTLGRSILCGTFQGFLLPVVSRHPALWSSDFPLLRLERANARPT